jgi:hypothetical protein
MRRCDGKTDKATFVSTTRDNPETSRETDVGMSEMSVIFSCQVEKCVTVS